MSKRNGTLWLFRNSVSISIGYFREWDMTQMRFFELRHNNWRWGYPVLDMTCRIHRLNINVTFWKLPKRDSADRIER